MGAEDRLRELGIELPPPARPLATYLEAVTTGNLVFVAGHGPILNGQVTVTGKIDRDLSIDQGYAVAREVGLHILSTLREELGTLDRVRRVVRLFGMVNSSEGFNQQHLVINGCSDLLVEIFGEAGRHARAAVGMYSLPLDMPVEIEAIVEVEPA